MFLTKSMKIAFLSQNIMIAYFVFWDKNGQNPDFVQNDRNDYFVFWVKMAKTQILSNPFQIDKIRPDKIGL